jgi:hypothetical protein
MKKEDIAQNILDYFFEKGATVSIRDWKFLLSEIEKAVLIGEGYANMSNEIKNSKVF